MMSWVESCEVTITRNEQVITYNAVVRRKGGTYVVLRSVEDALLWLQDMRDRYGRT